MNLSRRTLVWSMAWSAVTAIILRKTVPSRIARVESFQALCPAYVWPLLVPGVRLDLRLTARTRAPLLYLGADQVGALPGLLPGANPTVTVFRLDIDEFAKRHLSVRVVG